MPRGADSTVTADLPAGMDAYFGYLDGLYVDYQTIRARFPGAVVYSIAVRAVDDADVLDIETGDASIVYARPWFARQLARGLARPIFYTSVSSCSALVTSLRGVARDSYRLWTAHYGAGAHICSPRCFPGMTTVADGTQWVDHGPWDESLLSSSFIEEAPPVSPVPTQPLPPAVEAARQGCLHALGESAAWLEERAQAGATAALKAAGLWPASPAPAPSQPVGQDQTPPAAPA